MAQTEYEKMFGNRTRGRTPLTPEEKARREKVSKLTANWQSRARNRAYRVLAARYPDEFSELFDGEIKGLEGEYQAKIEQV